MLNSVEWEYFKLEDLFEMSLGKHKKRDELSPKPVTGKDVPHITSSSMNNGVDGYSSESNAKNVITIGTRGSNFAFYHKGYIFASGNVAILDIKNSSVTMNEHKALFITVIINNEQYRWSYGFNPTLTRLKRMEIKLPIGSNGEPNWKFMEDYMKSLSEGSLEEYSLPKNNIKLNLDDREWDEFKLEGLFEIERGKSFSVKSIKSPNGVYPIITASENMPDTKTLNSEFAVNNKHSIIVNRSGTTGHVRYIKGAFCPTENVYILTAKQSANINKFNSLFIVTILQKEKFRYMYGRTSSAGRLKDTIIKLPIKPKTSPDENSEPDWKFMEDYIKGLPYTNKL